MLKVAWQNVYKIEFYKEISLGQNLLAKFKIFTTPYWSRTSLKNRKTSSFIDQLRWPWLG